MYILNLLVDALFEELSKINPQKVTIEKSNARCTQNIQGVISVKTKRNPKYSDSFLKREISHTSIHTPFVVTSASQTQLRDHKIIIVDAQPAATTKNTDL